MRRRRKAKEANKISDEADLRIDRVDQETSQARSFLASTGSISSPVITHGTLKNESPHGVNNDSNKHLEMIKIPIFHGNKLEFQQWFVAFSTCVDKSSLSPQYKMLRLESCLWGEAAEAIKGLGYSETAYNAAKARLERKYEGDRRKVQSQPGDLRKMNSLVEGDPKSLDKFADIVERAVVVLKENGLHAELSGSTFYGIVVEKLPESLLKLYYRWVREEGKHKSMETLNEWFAEEADFQMPASEVKNGFTSSEDSRQQDSNKWRRRNANGKSEKSFGTNPQD